MIKYLLSRQSLKNFFSRSARESESSSVIVSTAWQIVEKSLRLCSALISGILIARYLQPAQYGTYNYALAFTSFFVAVSSLGTSQIFVRELVKEPKSNEIISSAFALRILSGILFSTLAIGISFVFISDALVKSLVVIFSFQIIFRSSEAIEFFFESRLKYRSITFSKSVSSIFSALLITILITKEQSILLVAVASSSEYLISLIVIVGAYLSQKRTLGVSAISISRIKSILSDSWPLIFSGIAVTIYMRIDQIMIKEMIGDTELGLYSAAVQSTEAFYLIPIAFIKSNFPSIIRLKEENETDFYSNLQSLYNRISFVSYISIVFVSIFAHRIITILYGTAYDKAAPIFTLLIWSVLFVTLGTARSRFMISMNLTKIHLNTVLIASAINILLNFLLIPNYGAFGAAIATVFSFWVATHGTCFLFRSLRKTGNMLTKSFILIR